MRCEFRRQQSRIRPADDDVKPLSKQPVHEELPFRGILYLIEEEMLDRTIDDIDGLEDFIKVCGFNTVKAFVVECHESKRNARRLERRETEN